MSPTRTVEREFDVRTVIKTDVREASLEVHSG